MESGAGRFTDFLLPPLTFHEFLDLRGVDGLVGYCPRQDEDDEHDGLEYRTDDLADLNRHFVDYLNFGGYPEAFSSPAIRSDPARYIGADIVDKVLLRDLPSLYGIQDVQELNALFMTLAYNTAGELSLDALSQQSGVSKPTIRRYLEYLEAAFLIKVVHRVDQNARRFKRANHFKVYVTTPALRCALFGPVSEDDAEMGRLAETAVFAQWFHAPVFGRLHYARWKDSEVDIVYLDPRHWQEPDWCVEVKWSDRPPNHPEELSGVFTLANRYPDISASVTTRTIEARSDSWPGTKPLKFIPTSLYCYMVGRNLTSHDVS